jgi:hypothetical protein
LNTSDEDVAGASPARLRKDRVLREITIHVPDDVLEDLNDFAREKQLAEIEPLIHRYTGDGLRCDLVWWKAEQKIAAARKAGERAPVQPGEPVSEQDVIALALRVYRFDHDVLRWLTGAHVA